ncbi:hypothetical protein MMC18_008132 [Xylographa bjoerkii]|nr:hypothetical protein [Xylographa bjoerkii]
MESAMMMLPDLRHHLVQNVPSTPMVMHPFDISMPLFTNLGVANSYPLQYPTLNPNPHSIPAAPYDTFAHCCQQPLLTPGFVFATIPDSASMINEHYSSSKAHEDLHIKAESQSPSRTFAALPTSDTDAGEANLGTHVDTLMRAIQIKTSVRAHSKYSLQEGLITRRGSSITGISHATLDSPTGLMSSEARIKKTYKCDIASCAKHFFQKTHLEIHMRAHTGYKPFSHQNKFHAEALRKLTDIFASMQEGDTVSATDKELWEYFSALYKNSNKGIKGRGKDRRISMTVGNLAAPKDEDALGSRSPSLSESEQAVRMDHERTHPRSHCSVDSREGRYY